MAEELKINKKLFAFDGAIGRRDFAINLIYLTFIGSIFTLPYMIHMLSATPTYADLADANKVFLSAGLFYKTYISLGFLGIGIVALSNWIRRLNDILGNVNVEINAVLGCIYLSNVLFQFYLPRNIVLSICLITSIIGCVLLFKKGKVTGNLPHDVRMEFNWGAFFGTWIWGLINNSYKTLWMLLLWWTPFGFYFQLLCGLKGNAWAYKNREWNDDEQFKASQKKQSIIWSVLSLIVAPVLCFIIFIALIIGLATTVADEAKNYPEKETPVSDKVESKLESFMNFYSSLYFETYTITPEENKFYISPKDWNHYSFSEKKNVFDMAAMKASAERTKKEGKYTSKTEELTRTKIYSSKNNELLGEFSMDEKFLESDKVDFKELMKAAMNAYKFYKATEE